jgi:hypothetical protein
MGTNCRFWLYLLDGIDVIHKYNKIEMQGGTQNKQEKSMAKKNKQAAQTQDKDLGQTKESQESQSLTSEDSQAQPESNEEVSTENVAASTPAPGNPYTVSADGRGRAYDPAVDGAPGEEAEAKQAEADRPQ